MNPGAQLEHRQLTDQGSLFEEDHVFLRKVLGWLASATDEGAIAALLDDLDEYLVPHFAREEGAEGFFEVVLQAAPRHAAALRDLKAEHESLLAQLHRVRQGLTPPFRKASEDLLERTKALIEVLNKHERREQELLFDALERDLGAGD